MQEDELNSVLDEMASGAMTAARILEVVRAQVPAIVHEDATQVTRLVTTALRAAPGNGQLAWYTVFITSENGDIGCDTGAFMDALDRWPNPARTDFQSLIQLVDANYHGTSYIRSAVDRVRVEGAAEWMQRAEKELQGVASLVFNGRTAAEQVRSAMDAGLAGA